MERVESTRLALVPNMVLRRKNEHLGELNLCEFRCLDVDSKAIPFPERTVVSLLGAVVSLYVQFLTKL